MNFKFKIISLTFLIAIFLFNFVAKSNSNLSNNEVVFWTLQLGTFDKYITNVIKNFEIQNPNIKIKWIDVPYSEGEKRTLAALLSDNPPDLINLTPDFSNIAAQKKALYPLPKEIMSSFSDSLFPAISYNGNFFAIPFYLTSAITYANSDLMKKANINSIPKTYEDMYTYANQIKQKTGMYVEMPALNENDTFLKILNKYDINIFNINANTNTKKIFELYKHAYEKNYIPKESITQSHRDALEKYMSGQIVFLQAGANFLNIIKENAPEIYNKTVFSTQLTGSLGKYDYSLMNLIIPLKAKNREAALKFATFLTNEENQLELAKLTSVLPANKYALNNQYFKTKTSKEEIARNISASQISNINSGIKNNRHKKNIVLLTNNVLSQIIMQKITITDGLKYFSQKIKDYEE